MRASYTIPGPEVVIWWGVHVPVLAAVFGIAGVLLGHLIAPMPAVALPAQRQLGVVLAGILLSISITIATGQRPLMVLAWSIGIGFSGITIFQTLGAQSANAARTLTDAVIDRLAGRVRGDDKDKGQ